MKFIWSYLKYYKKILAGSLVLATINQLFSLLDPQIFRLILDNYALRVDELTQAEFVHGVGFLLLGFIGVAFVSRLAKSFQDYYVNAMTQRMGARMYADSVGHSFQLPFSAFENQQSGEVLEILQKSRDQTQQLVQGLVNTVFLSLVGIIVVVIYASTIHWSVGVSYFAMIPILGVLNFVISRRIKGIQKNIVSETASLMGATTETLRNVELVKSMGLEQQEVSRLNEVNNKILGLELTKVKLLRKLNFIQGTSINAVRALLMFLMMYLIFQGIMTAGEYFSLFAYSFFLFSPLAEFGNVMARFYEAKASNEKLAEVLDREPEAQPENPRAVGEFSGISFNGVSFHYNETGYPALTNISMEVKAGETVAFVGPSGSGKSTSVKLLSGLYKPTEGVYSVNGISTSEIDFEALKQRMGLVAQETQLFAGTIRENLLFVRPDASDDECREVLRMSAVSSILERADKDLDTRIGEGGLKLSGGERQRLAIARALLRKPELIIFDEATSSLDSITEDAITQTIKDIKKHQSKLMMIIVAHRLSTIAHADRIYVFEKGQIIEQGTHEDLLKSGNLYNALWRQQMGTR